MYVGSTEYGVLRGWLVEMKESWSFSEIRTFNLGVLELEMLVELELYLSVDSRLVKGLQPRALVNA